MHSGHDRLGAKSKTKTKVGELLTRFDLDLFGFAKWLTSGNNPCNRF